LCARYFVWELFPFPSSKTITVSSFGKCSSQNFLQRPYFNKKNSFNSLKYQFHKIWKRGKENWGLPAKILHWHVRAAYTWSG
jgi:hypothetical protein